MHTGAFANERWQARAIPRRILTGSLGFACAATAATGALMQDERLDVHRDGWQLNHLMGVVRRERHQLAVAAGTGPGLDQVHLGRGEPRGRSEEHTSELQ